MLRGRARTSTGVPVVGPGAANSNTMSEMNPALAYVQWKEADAKAREKETELKGAWEAYDRRRGGAPSAELLEQVSQLRAAAQEKLTLALCAMRSQADEGRSGH
jgi:hypothetical protein